MDSALLSQIHRAAEKEGPSRVHTRTTHLDEFNISRSFSHLLRLWSAVVIRQVQNTLSLMSLYKPMGWTTGILFPAGTGRWSHPASYPVGTGGKATGA